MKKILSDEQLREIVAMYQAGALPKQIGEQFGIMNNSVTRILKRLGIERDKLKMLTSGQIDYVIHQYNCGIYASKIAAELGVNASTISRILKKHAISAKIDDSINNEVNNKIINYGTDWVVSYNNNILNKKYLSTIGDEEKKIIAKHMVPFYRSKGFPYPELTDDDLIQEYNSICHANADSIIKDGYLALDNNAGSSIAKHFNHHFFAAKSGIDTKPSAVEAFNNDILLEKIIYNRLIRNHTLSGNMLRIGITNSNTAYRVSFFNILAAKYIYSKYVPENGIIYDYSMGYGQRLLGALSLSHPITYIGVDPLKQSIIGNQQIFDFYNKNIPRLHKQVELYCMGSEDYCDPKYENMIDLAFSSPPYYNLEVYAEEDSQAYHNKSYTHFINVWWKSVVKNIYKLLKNNGIFIINIKNIVNGFDLGRDMLNIAYDAGFTLKDTLHFRLTKNLVFNNKTGEHKYEPLYVLCKENK